MAKEFATRGVTVNSVCPGFIESDMTAELNAEVTLPIPSPPLPRPPPSLPPALLLTRVCVRQYMEEVKKMIPLGRLGYASEVAGLTSFLALDPACNYITGHSFNVDGGIAIGQ